MWVGGRSARSLRRAVELGDGWAPFGLRTAELGEMLAGARESDAWSQAHDAARGPAPERASRSTRWPSPSGCGSRSRRFAEIGATGLNVRVVHHSRSHYLEQLAALAALVAPPRRTGVRKSFVLTVQSRQFAMGSGQLRRSMTVALAWPPPSHMVWKP